MRTKVLLVAALSALTGLPWIVDARARPFDVADLRSEANAADYLIVTPAALRAGVEPLAAYRQEHGLRVSIVTLEQIDAAFPDGASQSERIKSFIQLAATKWQAPKLHYVVLCGPAASNGEAPALPPCMVGTVPSDNPYGCTDEGPVPSLAVGRLPARSAEELKALAERIKGYEQHPGDGLWRRRFGFACGEGGYGPMVDGAIEDIFTQVVSHRIGPEYDVDVTYLNPSSSYCYPPSHFPQRIVERVNEGSLVFTYVGHGSPESFSGGASDGPQRVLHTSNVKDIEVKAGPPVMIVLACSTAQYDDPGTVCIGEALMRRPAGPMAFIGATRVSHPYCNALLGYQFTREIFREGQEARTLGDILLAVKQGLMKPENDAIRLKIEGFGGMMVQKEEQAALKNEHLALYNLFGDPALHLARPSSGDVALKAGKDTKAGKTFEVSGSAKGLKDGKALVSFECERTQILGVIEGAGAPKSDEVMLRNYKRANDKAAASLEVAVKGEKFRAALKLPKDLKPGNYFVKVFARGGGVAEAAAAPVLLKGAR